MSSIDAAEDANWPREAKRLRKDIGIMVSSHRSEFNVGLAVEFAIVQDTRTMGSVGIGEPLFDCVHHLALSQLKPYGNELHFTKLWGGQIESCMGRTCVFCTNLPPYAELKLESSEKETRLLQIYRDVIRLFQEGRILLESMPNKLKELTACDLGEGQIRGAATKDPRLVAYTNGHEWLSTLFSASWRPDHPRSLSGERSTIVEKSPQMTREDANRYMEVPYPSSRVWESSGCFFDIRRNLFGDSIRLIDWLLNLVQADGVSETPNPDSIEKVVEVPALSEMQYRILQAMWELEALSADTRKTTDEIALKSDGSEYEVNTFKPLLADLTKKHGLTQSKVGKGGGIWLTEMGIEVIKKVIDNGKANVSKR